MQLNSFEEFQAIYWLFVICQYIWAKNVQTFYF